MRIALDTNRYADLFLRVADTVVVVEEAEAVVLPFVVIGEVRAGFRYSRREVQHEASLRQFLATPGVSVLFADDQTTHHYAAIYHQLRAQGTPIPTNDMWIAALVLQHNLALHTRDRHFDHLPQMVRV